MPACSDCGMAPARALECREMLGRKRGHRRDRAPGRRRVLAGDERLGRRAGGGKHVARHVALAARAMQRDQRISPVIACAQPAWPGGFGGIGCGIASSTRAASWISADAVSPQ